MPALAYADMSDPTQSNFIFVFIAAGGSAGIFVLAALVIYFARRGRQRWTRFLITAALFWAMVAVGSLITITLQQLAWQKQYRQDLMSGYGDPQATGPGWHLVMIGFDVMTYLLLLAWSAISSR